MMEIPDITRVLDHGEARADGYKIARKLLSLNLNPFPEDSPLHEQWAAGWHAAICEMHSVDHGPVLRVG